MWRTRALDAAGLETAADVHLAAGVGGDDGGGFGGGDVVELVVEDAHRYLGIERAVDTGIAAAEDGVAHLDKLDSGYGL